MNLYPYTNFHDLNLDWLLQQLRKAVFKVNNTEPDENGNVNLAGVSGVTSVNGIGADGSGNISIGAADVNAVPASYIVPYQVIGTLDPDNTSGLGYAYCWTNTILRNFKFTLYLVTPTNYYTVMVNGSPVYRIPIVSFSGNPFALPTTSITDPNIVGGLLGTFILHPTQVIENDLLTWSDTWICYDGNNTIIFFSLPGNTDLTKLNGKFTTESTVLI